MIYTQRILATSIYLMLSFSFLAQAKEEKAIFAAGCFWCIQPPYEKLKDQGVISTSVGYSGGATENPTYETVSSGSTTHLEVIEVTFNPEKITYEQILEVFWKNIDPLDDYGQFCDKGPQYKSAIYYTTPDQEKKAKASKTAIEKILKSQGKVVTPILPAKKYYAGEDYHQLYYQKNPLRYKAYRYSCGRDKRLKEVWK